jgi:ATP-dependent DNA ligase
VSAAEDTKPHRELDDPVRALALEGHELEGIVAKRLDSRYRPGDRSRDWVKAKTAAWRAMHAPARNLSPK